jgi:hypothetical protein
LSLASSTCGAAHALLAHIVAMSHALSASAADSKSRSRGKTVALPRNCAVWRVSTPDTHAHARALPHALHLL